MQSPRDQAWYDKQAVHVPYPSPWLGIAIVHLRREDHNVCCKCKYVPVRRPPSLVQPLFVLSIRTLPSDLADVHQWDPST